MYLYSNMLFCFFSWNQEWKNKMPRSDHWSIRYVRWRASSHQPTNHTYIQHCLLYMLNHSLVYFYLNRQPDAMDVFDFSCWTRLYQPYIVGLYLPVEDMLSMSSCILLSWNWSEKVYRNVRKRLLWYSQKGQTLFAAFFIRSDIISDAFEKVRNISGMLTDRSYKLAVMFNRNGQTPFLMFLQKSQNIFLNILSLQQRSETFSVMLKERSDTLFCDAQRKVGYPFL